MADPGVPRWRGSSPRGVGRLLILYTVPKLYENERNWTERGDTQQGFRCMLAVFHRAGFHTSIVMLWEKQSRRHEFAHKSAKRAHPSPHPPLDPPMDLQSKLGLVCDERNALLSCLNQTFLNAEKVFHVNQISQQRMREWMKKILCIWAQILSTTHVRVQVGHG